MRRAIVLLCMSLILFLPACGRKGPVRPLHQTQPLAVEGLSLQQKGNGLALSWNLPTSPEGEVTAVRIYRLPYDLEDGCPECSEPAQLLRQIDLDYLQGVQRLGRTLIFTDTDLRKNTGYIYRVVPVNRKGRQGDSAIVFGPFFQPPLPPDDIMATGRDRLVQLEWSAVTDPRQGVEVLGYNLYRTPLGVPFPNRPINSEVLTELSYDDFAVKNGQVYRYAVRTVIRILKTTVESSLSPQEEVIPRPGR